MDQHGGEAILRSYGCIVNFATKYDVFCLLGDHLLPRLVWVVYKSRPVNSCSPCCLTVALNDLGVYSSEEG